MSTLYAKAGQDKLQTWQPGRSCSTAQYAVCRAAHSLLRSSADVAHWKLDPPKSAAMEPAF